MALFVKCFPWGALVRLTAAFTDDAGEPIDPTTVTVRIMDPLEATAAYVYGTDITVVRDSAGNYHYDLDASTAGEWVYRWEGTGAGQAVAEAAFKVATSVFEPGSP